MPDDEDWGGSGGGEDVAHALSTSGQLALSSVLAAPDIDPAVWRAETERVARRLDAGHGSAWARAGGEDWSQHLEALRSYRESASGRGAGGRGVAHEWEDLTPAVGVLRRTVHSGLAQVAAAEKVLCASPAVSEAASRYAHHKQVSAP